MDQLTIALAKGRTAKQAIKLLQNADITFPDFHPSSRKLVFRNPENTVKLVFVKSVDVCTYVETGAADIGVVGKDNILEADADIYELLDLRLGKCKFCVAGPKNTPPLERVDQLTVASKYPRVAKQYFLKKGIPIETIKLNGSVELAPIIGMADVIVDIVETGNTIRENGLKIIADIKDISTRLIVNKASFATKTGSIQRIIDQIKSGLECSV
ncbi:ATP phosphoribosyltransferase [Virgibacillus sp. 179-BFC.A HS]|uniref:ATP phosphoribosyltransferase n=1 Tax=Tigheibacillus jepli TaxID=3035914 RepID=A0ABU5CKR7_9BACI|nr:ATP phosphoribosyltransferase [Virgibacillus sp. 179-BFC.A HS]MDY0406820.1 ATP phosphoribosyltransferase [Virgibacillus sp. 179-BFC.A HS]